MVAEVKGGLAVEIAAASRLICNLGAVVGGAGDDAATPIGGVPMITVSEGFADAWEMNGVLETDTNITIKALNLPREWSCGGR